MTSEKKPYRAKLEAVTAWLNEFPDATNRMVANEVGCTPEYVGKVRKRMAHVPPCAEGHAPNTKTEEVLRSAEAMIAERNQRWINAQTQEPQGVDAILDERGSRYGPFTTHAAITQQLKSVVEKHLYHRGKVMAYDQKEALDMIFHKIGRIINGDPDYADSWVDIAGYAKLVADRLEGKVR